MQNSSELINLLKKEKPLQRDYLKFGEQSDAAEFATQLL